MASEHNTNRRYTVKFSQSEVVALTDIIADIDEYVTEEMFSSPKGLSVWGRITEKIRKIEL
tara:strand:- start:1024 stop:1206 length:183 start_codon:yes stop_codon:yes gene_type:complete